MAGLSSDPVTIAVLAVVVIVAFGAIRWLLLPKRPRVSAFKCARCGVVARHTNRTEQAWRAGAKRLFCDACHRNWLATRPAASRPVPMPRGGGDDRHGCLTVVAVLSLVPIAMLASLLL